MLPNQILAGISIVYQFIEAGKKYNQKLQELSTANAAYEALFEKMMTLE